MKTTQLDFLSMEKIRDSRLIHIGHFMADQLNLDISEVDLRWDHRLARDKKFMGWCAKTGLQNKPYVIGISEDIRGKYSSDSIFARAIDATIIDLIAHEFVHVQQHATRRLDIRSGKYYWKGKHVVPCKMRSYTSRPWETEANRIAKRLTNRYTAQHQKGVLKWFWNYLLRLI